MGSDARPIPPIEKESSVCAFLVNCLSGRGASRRVPFVGLYQDATVGTQGCDRNPVSRLFFSASKEDGVKFNILLQPCFHKQRKTENRKISRMTLESSLLETYQYSKSRECLQNCNTLKPFPSELRWYIYTHAAR